MVVKIMHFKFDKFQMRNNQIAAFIKNEKGISFIEILLSMLLFSIVGLFMLYGISTSYLSLALADERETAKNLAESEIEYIKLTNYTSLPPPPWSYDLPSSTPEWDGAHKLPPDHDSYSMLVQGTSVDIDYDGHDDSDIQKITIIVSNNDENILTLSDYVLDLL